MKDDDSLEFYCHAERRQHAAIGYTGCFHSSRYIRSGSTSTSGQAPRQRLALSAVNGNAGVAMTHISRLDSGDAVDLLAMMVYCL